MTLRILTFTTSLVTLAACGGTTTTSSATDALTFSDVQARAEAFTDVFGANIEGVAVVRGDDLPEGTATYSGISVVGNQTSITDQQESATVTFAAIGTLEATVNFDAMTISADGDNYFEVPVAVFDSDDFTDIDDLSGTAIDGAITYTMAESTRIPGIFSGTATGTVTPTTGTPLAIDVTTSGAFAGDGASGFILEGFNGEGGPFAGGVALKN